MKKIMNKASDMVPEMCRGLILSHPDLDWDKKYHFIFRKNLRKDKVILISGGGSGHEPAHGGFVGEGMLDAAVCGDIFASPSQVQVYQAIKRRGKSGGPADYQKLQRGYDELQKCSISGKRRRH